MSDVTEVADSPQRPTDRIGAYADAMFDVALAEGILSEVEDELFRFARAYEASDELRDALTDPHIPAGQASADRRRPPRAARHARDHRPRVDGRGYGTRS